MSPVLRGILRYVIRPPSLAFRVTTRPFHVSRVLTEKPLPPRLVVNEDELEENFLKGSGPGGQKINKTSSAVQLKHLPTGIVVKSQATRSRSQNRKIARKLLSEKLEVIEKGEQSRTAIKAEATRKKKASKSKKSKRKYRALDAREQGEAQDEGDELGEMNEGDGVQGELAKEPSAKVT